jgi:hypothetical protein
MLSVVFTSVLCMHVILDVTATNRGVDGRDALVYIGLTFGRL